MALSPKREIKPAPDGYRNAILIHAAWLTPADADAAKDPDTGRPLPVKHPAGTSLIVSEPIAELWAERGIATVL